jgi:hypothetical protein
VTLVLKLGIHSAVGLVLCGISDSFFALDSLPPCAPVSASVGVTSGQVSIFATLVSCSVFRVVDLWLFVSPRFGEGCPRGSCFFLALD